MEILIITLEILLVMFVPTFFLGLYIIGLTYAVLYLATLKNVTLEDILNMGVKQKVKIYGIYVYCCLISILLFIVISFFMTDRMLECHDWLTELSSWLDMLEISVVMSWFLTILPELKIVFNQILENKKDMILYNITILGTILIYIFLINYVLYNYFEQNLLIYIIQVSLVLYIYFLISYLYYNSYKYKNKKLTKHILKINKRINAVIDLIGENTNEATKSKRKYNKLRRKINVLLSKKRIYQTFHPLFIEDETVKKSVLLFNILGHKEVENEYLEYISLFRKNNSVKLLTKATSKMDAQQMSQNLHDFSELLKGVCNNNDNEIDSLTNNENTQSLYKKYKFYDEKSVTKKWMRMSAVVTIMFCLLIIYLYL